MKLRHTGEIRRRATKGSFPWMMIIVLLVVASGVYWLYQNPPKLPEFNVNIPDIEIPFIHEDSKRLVILFIPGLDASMLDLWRDELPNLQVLASQGHWNEVVPVKPAIPSYNWSVWATGNTAVIEDIENKILHPEFLSSTAFSAMNISMPTSLAALPVNDAGCFWSILENKNITTIVLDTFSQRENSNPMDSFHQETGMRTQEIVSVLNEENDDCIVAVWHTFIDAMNTYHPVIDEDHPLYDMERAPVHLKYLREMVQQLDQSIQTISASIQDENTRIMIVSGQGFPKSRYQVNVNTWLWKNGYLQFKEGYDIDKVTNVSFSAYKEFVDWEQTQVYSLGMGNIHIQSNEEIGSIQTRTYEGLKLELQQSLSNWTDHRWETMYEPVVSHVETTEPKTEAGPVFKIAFYPNYTVSKQSFTGMLAPEMTMIQNSIPNNEMMVQSANPGVFITDVDVDIPGPLNVAGIAPIVLQYFGIEIPETMSSEQLYLNSTAKTVSSNY